MRVEDEIRVLHVLEATLGGTRRYLDNVIRACHESEVVSGLVYSARRADPEFKDTLEDCSRAGWQLFELQMRRKISPISDLSAIFRMRRILRNFRPDIVHCHSSKGGGVGRVACKLWGLSELKTLYSPHSLAAHVHRKYLFLERLLNNSTDHFVAVSEGERAEIEGYRLGKAKQAFVVPVVVALDRYPRIDRDHAREELELPVGRKLVLGVGRLTRQKDPVTFLKILRAVCQKDPGVLGVWVGDGELRTDFETEGADLLANGQLQLTGWRNDVQNYMAAADVILISSRYEGLSTVCAEALAMARPVVATNVAGMREIIGDRNLFEREEVQRASGLVCGLLDNTGVAESTGRQGRRMVEENFSLEVMTARLLAMYRTVSGSHHPL